MHRITVVGQTYYYRIKEKMVIIRDEKGRVHIIHNKEIIGSVFDFERGKWTPVISWIITQDKVTKWLTWNPLFARE
jgi:hypothetical protein